MGHGANDPADRHLHIEFTRRRDGMIHAMDGGLWLHRHVWYGRAMAHLISTDRALLLAWGEAAGLDASRLQYKPLKDPRTAERRDAWHWDLAGPWLPAASRPRPPGQQEPERPAGRARPHDPWRPGAAQNDR